MTIFLQATVEGLSLAAIYSLVALGFVLIYKAMDVLSFAQPALADECRHQVPYGSKIGPSKSPVAPKDSCQRCSGRPMSRHQSHP